MKDISKAFIDKKSKDIWECLKNLNETGDYKYLVSAHLLNGIKTDEIYIQQTKLQQLKKLDTRLFIMDWEGLRIT